MLLKTFITCQPVNLIHDKKCISLHYKLSFQFFINSPPRWASLAVLQTMLKLLSRSQLKITLLPLHDNNKLMKDVKRRFLRHSGNTPEIKFECQQDKQLSNIWSFISIYFKFVLSSFVEAFTVTKLIQLTFSNVRLVPLRQFPANSVKALRPW